MVRDVDLHDLLLVRQQLALGPLHSIRSRHVFLKTRILIVREQVEHAHLAAIAVLLALCRTLKKRCLLDEVHELFARVPRRIERTALDKGFERLSVVALRINAVHEVVQTGERTVLLALLDDLVRHVATNAAHADQAETDAVFDRGELRVRGVDIGRQHWRAVVVAAGDVADQAIGVAHVTGQHCRHVLVRVMRLQVSRAHNQDRVRSRMRFVERVLCELLGIVPDLLGDLKRVPVLDRAVVPILLQHAHDVELLLAHCLAQLICLAGGKAAHDHGHLHDLLLVHHGAVGFLEHRTKSFVVVMYGRLAACYLNVVVNHAGLQRARTIQGDRSHDVTKPFRWQAREQADVQATLNLEQTVHVTRTHERERRLIVGGDLLGNDIAARGHLHVTARAREHAQRSKAKEVHLQQAQVRRVMTVVLRDDAAALGIALDRHMVGHRVSADDGCARMHALAAHVTLDGLRRIHDRLDVLFGVVGLLQIGIGVQRLLDGDAQLVADHLADLIAYAVGIIKHARGIAHGVLRLQLAERDNARNMIGAIHLANMLDNLLATLILEVAVDIWHLHAFRGKESLKQQAVG